MKFLKEKQIGSPRPIHSKKVQDTPSLEYAHELGTALLFF